MNLAIRDIKHNAGRFVFTTLGIGLLLMVVLGMSGIYRGLIYEATLLVNRIGADLWLVQGGTRGPFAELSRIPGTLEDRARAVPGVASARRFISHTIQREHQGKPLRIVVQGLSWPEDGGSWIPLISGHALEQAHYQMIADQSLGLKLGESITLGEDLYEVVGLTRGLVGSSGDGLAFFTISDAQLIQFHQPGEALRLERAARRTRVEAGEVGRQQPLLLERAEGQSNAIPALAPPQIGAVLIHSRSEKLSPPGLTLRSTPPLNKRTCCSPAWWTKPNGSLASSGCCSSSFPPSLSRSSFIRLRLISFGTSRC